jgi:cytochrome-b5 reductase
MMGTRSFRLLRQYHLHSAFPIVHHHHIIRANAFRSLTTSSTHSAQWNPLSRKTPQLPPQAIHGRELPPRPKPPPSLKEYVFTKDYFFRGLYRSLLIAVVVIPVFVLWGGPVRTNHVDGDYEAFELAERIEIAKGHSYFILKRKVPQKYWWVWYEKEVPEPVSLAQRTPIMSLKIKNPSLEIQRSYTPLSLSPNEIHLVVKRYPEGELSRFLHILTPGTATVWVNQGRQEWVYNEEEWDHVVFIAGGTGITPAFQLCLTALQRQKFRAQENPETKKTRFTVLAASRDLKSILLRDQFKAVNDAHGNGNLDVQYFVDSVSKDRKLPEDIHVGPITESVLREKIVGHSEKGGWFKRDSKKVETKEKVMVLVCGPDGFTRYISGEHGGVTERQGVKGGLLKNIDGIELFKLLESRGEQPRQPERPKGMRVLK